MCVGNFSPLLRPAHRLQERHVFHVRSLREHVDRLDFPCLVAQPGEPVKISGKRAGGAGDVDHPFRGELRRVPQYLLVASPAGRIEYDEIHLFTLFLKFCKKLRRIPRLKAAVVKTVQAGIFFRIGHSRLHRLYTDYLPRLWGEEERNPADPAVEVDYRFAAGKGGPLADFFINDPGSAAVDLIEGARRDGEADFAYGIQKLLSGGEEVVPFAQD